MTFTDHFGDTARNRLLDFLGDHPASDYSITEMAEKSGVSRQSIYNMLPDLERKGFIEQTRTLGQSRLFTLNTDHPVIQSILSTDLKEVRESLEREARERERKEQA